MIKYTQAECYRIAYELKIRKLMIVELKPDGIPVDRWSRIANIAAVRNTWWLFNNQHSIPTNTEILYTKPLAKKPKYVNTAEASMIVSNFNKVEILWTELTPDIVVFHLDNERYLGKTIKYSYQELKDKFNIIILQPRNVK